MANQELLSAQKQDMVNIIKYSSQYEIGNPANAKIILKFVNSKGMMTSSIGKTYIKRLEDISDGVDIGRCSCVFCKTNMSVDGIICEECEEKYSGGRLHVKKSSVKPSSIAVVKTSAQSETTVATGVLNKTGDTVQKFANKVDQLAGGEGKAELKIRVLFSDVLKHHTTEEAERIFIHGTDTTTPLIKDISTNWPAPWLYSRVALSLFLAFVILEVAWKLTTNGNLLPGMMFVGSSVIPFSIMIFFFETNAPQNISIFRVVQIFFVGGCASLLSTLILFEIVPVGGLSFIGAILVGIIEEVGKMLIVAWYIKRMRDCMYILNGLLVGSAVGAGFAVFESAGYAFNYFLSSGYDGMVHVINTRALLSPGGHVAWAAVTGAAIMIALDGKRFTWDILKDPKFLRLFVFPIALHAIWDMPIYLWFLHPILIIIIWIVLLVLIQNGLREIQNLL